MGTRSTSAPSAAARRSSPTRTGSRLAALARLNRKWPSTRTMASGAVLEGAATASVIVEDLRCPCCADEVLDAARALTGVGATTLDYQRGVLEVTYDATLIDEETVR